MRKLILSIALALCACVAFAQNNCDIALGVYFGDADSEMTQQNMNYLKSTLNKAISQGNNLNSLEDSQFGIVVKTDVYDEHVIAGAPTKTVLNISMTFYVGDVMDGKLFSSWSIDLNGVGNSKGKAFNNAIHKLNPNNKELAAFASRAKDEIIGYYNNNYASIIRKAESEAALRNYEEAIYRLMCIPECCVGYDQAMAKVRVIYKQYIDQQCHENIAQAQAAWMSGFTKENAAVASIFLSEIYPDAACYGEAQELIAEIKRHMGEEWKFEMKQWSDLISVDAQQLQFAREIALAFAQNQPQQVIHLLYR